MYKEGWKEAATISIIFEPEPRENELNTVVIFGGSVIKKIKSTMSLPPHSTLTSNQTHLYRLCYVPRHRSDGPNPVMIGNGKFGGAEYLLV